MSLSLQSKLHTKSINKPHIETSLIEVTNKLPLKPPCRIFFKNEYEQPSGSFKLRGIGNLVYESIKQIQLTKSKKKIEIFASSGGNAGLAAAYCGFYYNVKCTVVLPKHSKLVIQEKLKDLGAKIILYGKSINEADQYLKGILNSIGDDIYPIYCHPFNNPLIWKGHSSLVDELAESLPRDKIKSIVASFGGGGLYNGIYEGILKNDLNSDVLLLETKQAPTLTKSLEANDLITLDSVNSLATSLACSYTTQSSLEYYHNQSKIRTNLELIDDLDCLKSCVEFNNIFNEIVEPACGAALSVCFNKIDLLYKNFKHLKKDDIVVIVVCGGSCTTKDDLKEFERLVTRSEIKL
ncbi:unnamed protein product [Candida verbasci]|uniref:L-serine ammonia-lyase n=1 Tax=Candida verbasci TaxID=1227364 RepID=A0A9W4TQI9_9ASCO|nr:unnamed protein product [Candida verbasci]